MELSVPPASEPPTDRTTALNLKQVARLLDVHYMTAYRYVRHGRLPAHQVGGVWFVEARDLEHFRAAPEPGAGSVDWAARLAVPLAAGDEVGAWTVVRDAMSAGHDVEQVHLGVIAGAVALVGAAVDAGRTSSVEQRLAATLAMRLVSRLGSQVARRGRKLGTVVLATPPGEHHGLALALVANLVRHAGFVVAELGTDVPAADVLAAIDRVGDPVAVGLSVTTAERLDAAADVMATVRAVHPALPILLGGQAVRNAEVAEVVGATSWSAGPDLVATLESLADARRRTRART